MQLPVFEGVVEALEKHSVRRKRELEMDKTTPAKKRKVLKWSKEHGHDTYFGSHHESRSDCGEGKPRDKQKCCADPHTSARVTETALSTSAVFCVPKRRTFQRELSLCTGTLPTPTRSAMLTCSISVVWMMPRQTVAQVRKVWWLCVRVELKGEPTREAAP